MATLRSGANREKARRFPSGCRGQKKNQNDDMSANDPTNDRPIKVSIVEDDSDTRANLIDLLAGDAGLRCLGSYMTAEAALEGIPVEKPDVALVDINLPGMSGIECVQKLKGLLPRLQVLMLTTYEERELIFKS